ncbi:pyridoxal kinase [Psychromarinibacter sp. C21-152]|uniref:pyridoxal kinase n=1 Tax=Psychromarinibacter sediminicola TaxID=3033385 RepID=A0AAE3NQS3_9RHOB|nr:pyridoxal kinase [Psychromarinibacter sediminicola]MDF0600316.1 pyridoxal kinase [Psychromarinibacter sediminicola]
MARILILSSWVAHGHVGLSAAAPVLQALGHTVTQLPTVVLSNHPGWPRAAGHPVPPETLAEMVDALDANGFLHGQDAVLTGYLPGAAHVAFAADLVDRLRAAAERPLRVVVDPVLGDAPKGLYLPEDAAAALRDRLVPLADVLTPNLFELGWLAGGPAETRDSARTAAQGLMGAGRARTIHVTSVPDGPARTGVLTVTRDGAELLGRPLRDGVPHGVGDVFAALIAAGLPARAALGHLDALIEASLGAPHLRIAEAAQSWTRPAATLPPA